MEFNELNLIELDKELTQPEKDEWNAIYASYRSGSVITGTVAGVDYHEFSTIPKGKKKSVKESMRCLIVIKYRIKIIIPETEVFIAPVASGGYVLHSMCGADADYVVTYVDREGGFAVASRKKALEKMQMAIGRRKSLVGKTVDVKVISVGQNVCTVNYSGYDVRLNQRDISYSIVPDLRNTIKPGEVKKAVITEFSAADKIIKLSVKYTMPHPFEGVEIRHPIGSTRIATIVGKYGGGVFCRLYDNVTDVLSAYDALHCDGDFAIGDSVEILIKKFNIEKKLVYGKMLRKMR